MIKKAFHFPKYTTFFEPQLNDSKLICKYISIYPFKYRASYFHVPLLKGNTCKCAHQMHISIVHCICLDKKLLNIFILFHSMHWIHHFE